MTNRRATAWPALALGLFFAVTMASCVLTLELPDLLFPMRYGGYRDVARLVEEGKIQPYETDSDGVASAKLPPKYSGLSLTDDITFRRTGQDTMVEFITDSNVFFETFTLRYQSDDHPPEGCSPKQNYPHWYSCLYR